MFEKDIYQLIRGLRAHKGNERQYIQHSLAECRKEIRGPDMDQKATALLKLVYLEMFGHDMSWASFNVLEVMSSSKYLQKRVGYLAAVQSFRPETEVLMLAENLLKKDLGSADKIVIGLVLGTVPHVVTPSMADSLLIDLLPRLTHSNPAIRKKVIVTLYRLALVYPETLRPAWPRIKERLQDEDEDPSVTAAIINVVCELGWRRPRDFLPLAPRLFELLTAGGNNWMAIKIIKLFSALTPLEPRLVKKLLPALTSLIKTTPAMSLLYECINGIIQGGIMEAAEGTTEGDEVARLCVNKLRAMLVVEGDPNLRYVALLAFAKITSSHADLVAEHQDVILECIDDGDISIRNRAMDLVVGMINANNLQTVIERLMKQLRSADVSDIAANPTQIRASTEGIVPMADEDDDMQVPVNPQEARPVEAPPLPDDYRTLVIERILEMCSSGFYRHMDDFEWYIGVLVELVKQCPAIPSTGAFGSRDASAGDDKLNVAGSIGAELLNVAVRVKAVRPEAAAAAQSLLMLDQRDTLFPAAGSGGQGVLAAAAFIAGEYASLLPNAEMVLTSLIDSSSAQLPAGVLASYIQAIPKLFAILTSSQQSSWSATRKSTTLLLIARIVHFMEPLTLHPHLDVQERAVEYLDLMRLASEASSNQPTDSESGSHAEPPLLLTQAIPALFSGMELNPVASSSLRKVPLPADLDLDTPINPNLQFLLRQAEDDPNGYDDATNNDIYTLYHSKPSSSIFTTTTSSVLVPASDLLPDPSHNITSPDGPRSPATLARQKASRRERYRDDPYYISPSRGNSSPASISSTPTLHAILRRSNGESLDMDAIPVLELKLDDMQRDVASEPERSSRHPAAIGGAKKAPRRRHFEIAADETLGSPAGDDQENDRKAEKRLSSSSLPQPARPGRGKKALLSTDSSLLAALPSFSGDPDELGGTSVSAARSELLLQEAARRQAEEEAMARAIAEVQRLRLEMQRAREGVGGLQDGDEDGVVVKAKVRRRRKVRLDGDVGEDEGGADANEGEAAGVESAEIKKKRKKKKRREDGVEGEEKTVEDGVGEEQVTKTKRKKKKRQVTFDDGGVVD